MDTKCLKISSWETTKSVHTPEIYFIKKEFDYIFFSNITFQFLGNSGYTYIKKYIYIYLQVDPSLITLYIVYAILILLAGLLQVIFPSRFLN